MLLSKATGNSYREPRIGTRGLGWSVENLNNNFKLALVGQDGGQLLPQSLKPKT